MLALMGSASAEGETCKGDKKCNAVETDTFDEDTEQDETTLLAINHEIALHKPVDCTREQKKSKDFCLKCTLWGKKCVEEAKVCYKQCAESCKKNVVGEVIGTVQFPDGTLKGEKIGTVGVEGIQFEDSTEIDLGDGIFDELSPDGMKVLAKIFHCRAQIGVVTANGIQFNEKNDQGWHIDWIRQVNDDGTPGGPFEGFLHTDTKYFENSMSVGRVTHWKVDVSGEQTRVEHEKDKLVIYKSLPGGKDVNVGQIRSDGVFLSNGVHIL